ncbi:MAG: kynureninase [Calditrichaeota bacterium]|nr:MAG: kynureninase [Calditrichota bacterium]
MEYKIEKSFAEELDANDPLAKFRELFYIPEFNGKSCIYFCGNSLGLQPRHAREYILQELQDWAELGVEAHFKARTPWLNYHEFLTEQTARLVGALPSEVVVMNTLTVNLHLMLVSFYRPTAKRHKILIEARAFPSDRYAVVSHIRFHGLEPEQTLIEVQPQPGEFTIRTESLLEIIEREGEQIALILLGGVNYYTGQAFEMQKITRAGHEKGCLVGFDLAHAVGNLELNLHDWGVDFAVWCSYKYLNGGPGCVAGCFVHERHAHNFDVPRFAGWWGHDKRTRFTMPPDFKPIPGAEGWQLSNPPILSMAPLRSSMQIFDQAGMAKLRQKSKLLTGYLEFLLNSHKNSNFKIITPPEPEERGCQLSIQVKKGGKDLHKKLIKNHFICDWREPDVIRVAPVPLYNRFIEVFQFAEFFKKQVAS